MVGRHAAGRRRAALATLGTLVLTGIPAAAAAAPPPAPGPLPAGARSLGADKPSAQILSAMERDLHLTRAQAEYCVREPGDAMRGATLDTGHDSDGTESGARPTQPSYRGP